MRVKRENIEARETAGSRDQCEGDSASDGHVTGSRSTGVWLWSRDRGETVL